jgi:glucose/arabinose dehydrogenase
VWSSGASTVAVAGAAFLSGSDWGAWSDSLVVATLKEQDLRRFTFGEGRATQRDVLLDQKYGRLRAATTAPDGSLLVTTSTGSGDRIIRIAPVR